MIFKEPTIKCNPSDYPEPLDRYFETTLDKCLKCNKEYQYLKSTLCKSLVYDEVLKQCTECLDVFECKLIARTNRPLTELEQLQKDYNALQDRCSKLSRQLKDIYDTFK